MPYFTTVASMASILKCEANPALMGYLQGYASYIYIVHLEEGKRLLAEISELGLT